MLRPLYFVKQVSQCSEDVRNSLRLACWLLRARPWILVCALNHRRQKEVWPSHHS